MKQINNHKLSDYDLVLDKKFGKKGTPSRIETEDKAYSFYTGQLLEKIRKEEKMTQTNLAEKIGSSKSYISRIETGRTEPKVSTFYRIVFALGRSVELLPR